MSNYDDIDDIFENNDDPVRSEINIEDPSQVSSDISSLESDISDKMRNLQGFSNAIYITGYDSLLNIYHTFTKSYQGSQTNTYHIASYRRQLDPSYGIDEYLSIVSAEESLIVAHFYADCIRSVVDKMSELNFFEEDKSFKSYLFRKCSSEQILSQVHLDFCQKRYNDLFEKINFERDDSLYESGILSNVSTVDRMAHNKTYAHSYQGIGVINSVIETRQDYITSLSLAFCYIADKLEEVISEELGNISDISIEQVGHGK